MNTSLGKVKEIFLAAAELEPSARPGYLDGACAGDADLRRDVEDMLGHHGQLGAFLETPADAPTLSAPPLPAERPGALLAGRYKLLEEVGEGGMGSVWMAEQKQPVKRLVAVKLIKAGMDSKAVLARFEAERQALALMDHPNIAKVLDGGVTPEGGPFFVMELVKGVPITKFSDEHRLTPRQRLELLVPVCQAIQHAHQKGVIHRDIKPSNVLVALYDDRPVPKVIDFGVAKATGQPLTERTLHTGFGAVVGTVEYMSPEQATFNQLDVDTRSDVYSLGVLLYELLTGDPPFSLAELGKDGMLDMLRVIREQEPSKPSTKLSTARGLPALAANRGTEPRRLTALVRGELDWIVMKCLEKDRSRRYETANALAMDLQRYLADEQVQACPPSVGYRLRKFARRNKWPVLAAVGLVAMLLMTLAVALYSNSQINRALGDRTAAYTELTTEQQKTSKARDAARESERLAKRHAADLTESLYFESIARADLEYRGNNVAVADQTLDRCPEELRNWEWHYLKRTCRSQLRTLNGHDAFVISLSFHPNGRWLVSGGSDGRLIIWDFVTGEVVRRLPKTAETVTSAVFSPDGRYVARSAGRWLPVVPGEITVFEVATGAEVANFKQDRAHIDEIAWSPDSREVAGASWEGVVKVCDVAAKTQRVFASTDASTSLKAVAWSRDRSLIAAGGNDGKVHVWDASTGKQLRVYTGHTGAVGAVKFSPNCKRLLSGGADHTIKVWDTQEGKLYRTLTRHSGKVGELVYSPDGQRFASACDDGTVKIWDAVGLNEVETIHAHMREARGIAYHPGGELLASGGWDKAVKVWDVSAPQRHRTVALPNARGRQIAVSPDGKTVAVAALLPVARGQPGYLRLYDLTTLKEAQCLSEHWGGHHSAAFHPDGHLLAADEDALVVLWDAKTGERRRALEGHEQAVRHVAFSPDRRFLATASEDKTVRLWNLTTYQTAAVIRGHSDAVNRVAFSNDSRTLVSAGQDGKVLLWPVGHESASPLQSFEGHVGAVNALAFRPNQHQFATGGSDDTVRIWDAATGRQLHRLGTHVSNVTALGFTPDGSRLASGGKDGLVVIWDATKGREALSFRRELLDVSGLAFVPDGRRLIAANHTAIPGGCRIWDAGRISPDEARDRLLALSRKVRPTMTESLAVDAQALYNAGKWQAAVENYDLAITDDPDNYTFRINRAFALGALGRLKEAREDYAHAIHHPRIYARSAPYAGAAFFYCNILVELGEIEAYQRESNYIRRRIGPLKSPASAYTVSAIYRIGPHPAGEITELMGMAEPLCRQHPKDLIAAMTMANVNYLAGKYQETLACLDTVTALRGTSKHNQIVETLYYALSHARLGNKDKAREYLSVSKAWLAEHLNSGKTPPGWAFAPNWSYRLDLGRLVKEAERLVEQR